MIAEPALDAGRARQFREGIELFNAGEHWHAHESWEHVWLGMSDRSEDDGEIVIRGLIQLAAALHLLRIGRLDGAASNFGKAYEKLCLAPPEFLGIETTSLRDFAGQQRRDLDPTLRCTITTIGER